MNLRSTQQVRWAMGRRGPSDPLEPENNPKPIHRVHPLFLAYGAKAVLPFDLDHGALRVKAFDRGGSARHSQPARGGP